MTTSVEPEILTRNDTESGVWDVGECAPKRGLPHTNIVDRKIVIPTDDTESSRCIRAHEMMHAKVSPADDWKAWIDRGIASEDALRVCEELRVNLLCQRAGFDMKAHLSDDGETADGERLAMQKDWRNAVLFAVATAGTASAKKYLTGIRRHNRDWGKYLKDIQTRAEKTLANSMPYGTDYLASTKVDEKTGLYPYGFKYTEALAEWIDRIAGDPPPEPEPEVDESSEGDKPTGEDDKHVGHGTYESERRSFEENLKAKEPDRTAMSAHGHIPEWGELQIGKLNMGLVNTGHMGKKRVATNAGRNPRRISRLLTDPQKRVFDRKVRGLGGIIVLDVSGSMSWTRDQIRTIVEKAPGATVLAYSWNREGGDNAWVLAEDGKVFTDDFDMCAGNGVDLPALEWAMKRRKGNEPIVWVTDGGVSGVNDGFSDMLTRQCAKYAKKHGILVYETLEQAVNAFKAMSQGKKQTVPTTAWPRILRYALAS